MPFVRDMAAAHDSGTAFTRHRRKACEWLVRVYDIMSDASTFLSAEEKQDLTAAIQRFLDHYQWLSAHAIRNGVLSWNYTPKFHYLQHIGMMAEMINPRVVMNYREESFIGATAILTAANADGRWERTLQVRTLRKYLVGFQILLGDLESLG
jgi:hypothetical protein